MKPAVDAESLIACSSCAKAKAKCDKRLPTCSRCLFKRLKCEPRQPRRYPETFQFLQAQSPSQSQTTPLAASTSPSPQANADGNVDEPFQSVFSTERNTNGAQAPAFEGLQWHHTPVTALNPCPGDLAVDSTVSSIQHFDSNFLDGAPFFSTENNAMDLDFPGDTFGIGTPQSQTQPPDSVSSFTLPSILPGVLTNQIKTKEIQNKKDSVDNVDEDWPCFGCNPPSHIPINPRTGSEYLMRLEKTLSEQSTWNSTDFPVHSPSVNANVYIEPVQESLRDKLMVISQGFFSRARDVHRVGTGDSALSKARSSNADFTGFFILPPAYVLEAFLQTYAARVEPYLPFFPGATICPTKLIASNDEKASVLLLLLMIALGAMSSPHCEAQNLASGLIETCRICIFDVLEKNVQLSAHPVMLRCALLYLHASAWSGNKWHMDLSAAQLRMFTSMLRHSRMLHARVSSLPSVDMMNQADSIWKNWRSEEVANRLAYSWVLLDQEMSLFHDRQPDFDINELNAPVPESDVLWVAPSAEVWHRFLIDIQQSRPHSDGAFRHSLADLFTKFMKSELSESPSPLSFIELRLLLHPLQAMTHQLNKSLMYFFNAGSQRLLQRLLTQLEEVQYLLKQWYAIASRTIGGSDDSSNYCDMVIYHLTCLNTVTYFPDIEQLSRGDTSPEQFRASLWAGKRCSEDAAQIWCHCGQILRYFRRLPVTSRPFWWNASVYRAALYMWAASLVSRPDTSVMASSETGLGQIAVDALSFDHPSIIRYMRHQDGIPILSGSDGTPTPLDRPSDIIGHCIRILGEQGAGSQFDEGIRARLSLLRERWNARQK